MRSLGRLWEVGLEGVCKLLKMWLRRQKSSGVGWRVGGLLGCVGVGRWVFDCVWKKGGVDFDRLRHLLQLRRRLSRLVVKFILGKFFFSRC